MAGVVGTAHAALLAYTLPRRGLAVEDVRRGQLHLVPSDVAGRGGSLLLGGLTETEGNWRRRRRYGLRMTVLLHCYRPVQRKLLPLDAKPEWALFFLWTGYGTHLTECTDGPRVLKQPEIFRLASALESSSRGMSSMAMMRSSTRSRLSLSAAPPVNTWRRKAQKQGRTTHRFDKNAAIFSGFIGADRDPRL